MANRKYPAFAADCGGSGRRIKTNQAGKSQALYGIGIVAAAFLCNAIPSAKAENRQEPAAQASQFAIPAGSLSDALLRFSETSGQHVLFNADWVRDLRTSGVYGRLDSRQALQKLLSGSGLAARYTESGSVALEQVDYRAESTGVTTRLPAVNVTAKIDQDDDAVNYNALSAGTATKTDARIFDTPATIQVVPKAIIQDQQAIGLGNLLQNVSGVSRGWGFGAGSNENFQIRGFNNTSIYRNGVLTPNSNTISLANTERVEVLKGPSGQLFGRSEPGGLINVITKRPQRESYYSLQQQFGSYDTFRTLLDATGSVNTDGSVLYRLNYEHLDSNSFRDFVFDDRDFIAPSLTWLINDKTQLDLDFIYQNRKTVSDSGIPLDLEFSGDIPGKIPRNFRGNEPTDFNNSEFYEADITLTHQFNEDWKLRTRFSSINTVDATAQTPSNENINSVGDIGRGFLKTAGEFESEYATFDLTGHFTTGDFRHTFLAGSDFYRSVDSGSSSNFRGGDVVPPINVFNPVYGFTAFLNDPVRPFTDTKNRWYGIYLQDQVEFLQNWQLLFGGRFDHAEFETTDAERSVNIVSPRVGLLYHPLSWLGVYGDYVETFNAVNQGLTVTGGLPDPEKSKEFEFGLKGQWLDGRLTANLAYYELTKANVQTPLPAPFVDRVAITGEQVSKGVELDVTGQLADNWRLIASYAYTDTEITKDSAPLDTVIGSSGAGNTGNRFANVPLHSGSVWTTYDFSALGAQGFSAGAGVYLVDRRAGNVNNSFYLPGYVRLDTLVRYQRKVGKSNVTLQLNVENLLDEDYFVSSNGFASFIHQTLPAAPRTFLGSVKVEF